MGSHSTQIITLANSIIGVGILAMPYCFEKVYNFNVKNKCNLIRIISYFTHFLVRNYIVHITTYNEQFDN